jgi:hypothetical protein
MSCSKFYSPEYPLSKSLNRLENKQSALLLIKDIAHKVSLITVYRQPNMTKGPAGHRGEENRLNC